MRRQKQKDVRLWLEQQPSLYELTKAFPVEWKAVQRELQAVLAERDFDKVRAYIESVTKSTANRSNKSDQLDAKIRQSLALAAVRRMCIGAATGVTSGKIRFNLVNGYIAQKLLFKRDLERKPASIHAFRSLWPLLKQRDYLMILVQPKGIYCFYSKQLIARLKKLIDGRTCLEIAAGDGTLSRFLQDAGVDILATDNHSWTKSITFNENVVKQDAVQALRERRPKVVICSWPPAGNAFEKEVFRTTSVQLYIVIGSRHHFGTGDWATYEEQATFELTEDRSLSKLVLPPEIEPAVYVFRRKAPAAG